MQFREHAVLCASLVGMTDEEALQLIPGDRVAFGDEGVQTRIVTRVERQRDGTVMVYATGDLVQAATAKDVH